MKGKLTILFLSLGIWGFAQERSDGGYTLEKCIEYALANSVDAKNAKLEEEIAKAKVRETIGIGLPQVTGTVTVQQSPTLQRFFTQYSDQQSGGFSILTPEDAQALGIQNGDVLAAENFFQLKGSGNADMEISQLIFSSSYFVGLQASNAFKDLAFKQTNQTNEQVVMNVSKAFYNVLISRERLELVESNLQRMDTLFRNTEAMYKNGFAEKIDVDRLKVNKNNLEVNKSELENLTEISMKLLKFQMNYPLDQDIVLLGSIEDQVLQSVELPQDDSWDYANRPDYQVLKANETLQKLNIKNKYAGAFPVISGFANLGYSTQSDKFGGLFVTNSDFEEVNGLGPDKWYRYSTIGLRLNWSIFTGLQRTAQIQQEKLSLRKIENSFESLKKNIDLDIDRSKRNLDNAIKKLKVQEESIELASDIFNITEIKFQEGVGSNLEIIEADNSLKEAQTNYYSALYDALVAQLELKKALGILYNN